MKQEVNCVEAFLTASEEREVIQAIGSAEAGTTGEIRVHLEKETHIPAIQRAKRVFMFLNMDQTRHRNAVLIYIAVKSKQFAVLGDKAIHEITGSGFWEEEKKMLQQYLSEGQNKKALIKAIEGIGEKLKKFFPAENGRNENELPDEISKQI